MNFKVVRWGRTHARDSLTLICSNSLSVSTLTDWLTILSSEELALCADSSLPCGSHCLQRSTKDLQGTQQVLDSPHT